LRVEIEKIGFYWREREREICFPVFLWWILNGLREIFSCMVWAGLYAVL